MSNNFDANNGFVNNYNVPRQESDFEESKNPNSSQPYPDNGDFSHQDFSNDYYGVSGQGNMFYPQYMSQFMPYMFPYMGPGHRGGGYFEKKGNYGRKKNYNQGPTTTQIVYAKKPKQLSEEEKNKLESDLSKLSISESKNGTGKSESTVEKLPHKIEKAAFYVIKSYSEEDIHKAIKNNCWCSTKDGNVKLHNAFVTAKSEYPIYLLFSVNSSGHFVGVAQMISTVDFEKNFPGWGQSHKWKGLFKISWVYIKDVPNRELRHLKNEHNDGKPVPNSRDCQEVPYDVGIKVLEIFETYKNQTSILDDYDFYEMQEKNQQQQH